jgi:hypothetical protein
MADPASVVLTLIAFLMTAIGRPTHMRFCSLSFHVEAARADGSFQIARPFGCYDYIGPNGGWTSRCAGEIRVCANLYCTGGTRAIIDADGCTVGCQRGGWQP